MKKLIAVFMLSALLLNLSAQTNTWLGNTAQWLNNANWSLGVSPTSSCSYDVYIPAAPSGGMFPIIGPALSPSVGSLTIESGATLTVGALGINICGSLTGGATTNAIIQGNGEIKLTGTALQTISGKLKCNRIRNLNTSMAGVAITGDVQVVFYWVCEDGDLTNNGNLTLLSDAASSAYIDFFTYSGAANYNGNITVQKYIDNAADGYRDVSFPVITTISDLTDDFLINGPHGVNCWYAYSPYPTFQEYREDENTDTSNFFGGFWSITNPASSIGGMKGYAARIYNAPLTMDVTGPMVFGTANVPLTNTLSLTPSADGWNLVGNPFCAPVKWSEIVNQNPGVTTGTCYRYSTTAEYAGTWNAHNGVTGVPLGTPDEISIGQGFFVQATGNATLSVNHTACAASHTVPFYKTDALSNEVRIKLSNGTNADEIVAYTDPAATNGYDEGKDALKMPLASAVMLGFEQSGKQYAIQVMNDLNINSALPLSVRVAQDGNYEFSSVALNVPGLQTFLKDALTDNMYNLEIESPSFELTAAQNYSGRFSIVFEEILSSSVPETEGRTRVSVSGHDIYIERADAGIADVSVCNLLGQQINGASVRTNRSMIQVPAGFMGYAVVRVQDAVGIHTRKVFIR